MWVSKCEKSKTVTVVPIISLYGEIYFLHHVLKENHQLEYSKLLKTASRKSGLFNFLG